MKIAYGTYAMPRLALEDAIPALAAMGYEGLEISSGPRHVGSQPDELTPARRADLRSRLRDHDMGIPAIFAPGRQVLTDTPEEHAANLAAIRALAGLARDLGVDGTPVIALGFGGTTDGWAAARAGLIDRLHDYDAVARREDLVVAAEAHVHAAVDRSERALDVLHAVASERVRLHFDMVHFFLAGELPQDAVPRLVPVTAHTHVMDAHRHEDGSFELLPLGQGDLDGGAYVGAMQSAGWTGYITLEISVRQWGQAGFDAIAAAQDSYDALARAFEAAGAPRG